MSHYNTPIYCSLVSTAHRIFTSVFIQDKKKTRVYINRQTSRDQVEREKDSE